MERTNNTVGSLYGVLRHYCKRDLHVQDRPIIPIQTPVKSEYQSFGDFTQVYVTVAKPTISDSLLKETKSSWR